MLTFEELRDSVLPLPTRDDGYRRVLMLGTAGAGKTTVVRQLLGTNPRTERFPSTSTAKTTVADTEIIPSDEPFFRAAVTFMPREEVEDHLLDNVWPRPRRSMRVPATTWSTPSFSTTRGRGSG